eukprot:CAMPEP_0167802210 /NCGR_PEP_ID=MMETSP0111_2-20121227/18976_1 /TAXON_ID=91324 /ORGANISM="Lotharella globosa, Strain CCCM811" /LENGTH=125 /DNA_ID=CAMNT_0007698187 /DNA_START=66 /DNA_END=440 /DNA_ORIENTATION=-
MVEMFDGSPVEHQGATRHHASPASVHVHELLQALVQPAHLVRVGPQGMSAEHLISVEAAAQVLRHGIVEQGHAELDFQRHPAPRRISASQEPDVTDGTCHAHRLRTPPPLRQRFFFRHLLPFLGT